MSNLHLSLEEEISNLHREGYNITVIGGILTARDIPYVNTSRTIERGILAFPVEFSSEVKGECDHTCIFFRYEPCTALGAPLDIVATQGYDFNIQYRKSEISSFTRKKSLPQILHLLYKREGKPRNLYLDYATMQLVSTLQ
jgi:hypothetical protein